VYSWRTADVPRFVVQKHWLKVSNSKTLRLGTCGTNPARDVTITASLFATLDLISGGPMEIGIGRCPC
jgi:hypothetical protein